MVVSDDVARVFLQAVISRGVISDKLAHVLLGKCVEVVKAAATPDGDDIPYDPNDFEEYINQLNNTLEPLDLKLCATVDEVVGKKIWALINTKGDELVQGATDYTPVEIAYFKALVEQIVLASSESYSISSMAALREVNNLKPSIPKTQAEVVLASFVAKGWLLISKRGRFSLSSRALLELQTYLKTNYEDDIHECTLCFELLTKGVGCYIPACSARLHNHCYQRFTRDHRTCPSCRADWSPPQKLTTIGEGAVRDGEDKRRANRRDEEEDGTDDTTSQELPSTKTNKKVKSRPTKSKQWYAEDEADDDNGDDGDDGEMEVDDEGGESQTRRH